MDRYFVVVPDEEQRKEPTWWLGYMTVWKRALDPQHEMSLGGRKVHSIPCASEQEAVDLAHTMRDAAANELLLRAKEIRAIQCLVSGK